MHKHGDVTRPITMLKRLGSRGDLFRFVPLKGLSNVHLNITPYTHLQVVNLRFAFRKQVTRGQQVEFNEGGSILLVFLLLPFP